MASCSPSYLYIHIFCSLPSKRRHLWHLEDQFPQIHLPPSASFGVNFGYPSNILPRSVGGWAARQEPGSLSSTSSERPWRRSSRDRDDRHERRESNLEAPRPRLSRPCANKPFQLPKNAYYFPFLGSKGIYRYWKSVFFFAVG